MSSGHLLRQEVALTMIHENQRALRRCEALVAPSALPDLANRIFQTLLQGLGVAYMKVSLELATDAISSKSDLKKNVDLSMQVGAPKIAELPGGGCRAILVPPCGAPTLPTHRPLTSTHALRDSCPRAPPCCGIRSFWAASS